MTLPPGEKQKGFAMADLSQRAREGFEEAKARLWRFITPEPNSGCWLWLGGTSGFGYGRMYFEGRMQPAHRVAYELYVGPMAPDMHACHKCDVACCVNPDHIFPGTRTDNMRDCSRKGRTAMQRYPERSSFHVLNPSSPKRAGNHPRAKLTDAQANEIFHSTESIAALSAKYGVRYGLIWSIRRGHNYKAAISSGKQKEIGT